jgi:hypothetical protein
MNQQLDAKSWQATQPLSCPLRDANKKKKQEHWWPTDL